MLDRHLMLMAKVSFVDTINPQSNKFVMGVKIKVTGDSKLNNSPDPEES